ncbi:MAG: cell envelope integrity protein CreD, partial [Candidatus Electrothrix sp. AR5]|nr:cell envelope integrity protein CreD [Candidatus Electrothrix sp. AR5]
LLLISLSEHIAFNLSYIIASFACVGLIGFYVSFVLRSALKGMTFAGILAGLYGALYLLIRSEDYALLMGSVLLFGILAFIMIITRRVNWYDVEAAVKKNPIAAEAAKGVL